MIGAYRCTKPLKGMSDDRLLIHCHCHGLAHFRVGSEHRVVKVEVQCLKDDLSGRIEKGIVLEKMLNDTMIWNILN